MALTRIYLIPLSVAILLPTTLFTAYTIAILKNHLEPLFPYVSEVGSLPPESCIFGQGLNIVAILALISVYIKYNQISKFPISSQKVSYELNACCLAIGIAACVGLDLLANFQESNVPTIHLIGVYVFCSFTTIYFTIQTWISFQMQDMGPWFATVMRFVIVLFCIVLSLLTVVAGAFARGKFKGNRTIEEYMMWNSSHGGWEIHLVSSFSQWTLIILYSLAFLTFVPEFANIIIDEPEVAIQESEIMSTVIEQL